MKTENARILVIDDDNVMRKFVVMLLKRIGAGHYQVAEDGQTGLQMVRSFLPNLIITDVHMGHGNGLDFIRALRSHPVRELRNIHVLMLSADSSAQTLHEFLPFGILGYLVKPPSFSSIKSKIEMSLKETLRPVSPVLH
jgi:two-component system chemotaxis response regulator CheY